MFIPTTYEIPDQQHVSKDLNRLSINVPSVNTYLLRLSGENRFKLIVSPVEGLSVTQSIISPCINLGQRAPTYRLWVEDGSIRLTTSYMGACKLGKQYVMEVQYQAAYSHTLFKTLTKTNVFTNLIKHVSRFDNGLIVRTDNEKTLTLPDVTDPMTGFHYTQCPDTHGYIAHID